jgi:hypothetical protein
MSKLPVEMYFASDIARVAIDRTREFVPLPLPPVPSLPSLPLVFAPKASTCLSVDASALLLDVSTVSREAIFFRCSSAVISNSLPNLQVKSSQIHNQRTAGHEE